jgi:hypothetical protein
VLKISLIERGGVVCEAPQHEPSVTGGPENGLQALPGNRQY